MKNFFYYYFSHKKAIIFLLVIIVVIQFYSKNEKVKAPTEYDFSIFQDEISQLNKVVETNPNKSFKVRVESKPHNFSLNKTLEIVEINSADTTGFESLPNIGRFYAKRICKYRDILGGFHSKSQLMEVYGIDSSRYNDFKDYINVDHRLINKINVNSSNSFDLRKHPYISYNIAQSIVNYRNQHGHYQSLKDLNKLHLIDSLIFRKIAPYLSIGDST